MACVRETITNLTLAVDDDILRRVRIRALREVTSVNSLVRDYLERLAGDSEAANGIEEFFAAVTGSGAGTGGRTWTRDELHAR
jgi:plasmid stability protein